MNAKNPEDRKAQRKIYKALHRDKVLAEKRRYRLRHLEQCCEGVKRHHHKIRVEAMNHYSNPVLKCLYCGETHTEFLELACLNSDVCINKKGLTPQFGNKLYEYLKANNYPEGYGVICSNCNLKRLKERARNKGEGGTHQQRVWYNRKKKLHDDVFSHYAINNKIQCACCGESDIDTLCMDHKNGDGAAHRKTVSGSMYRWIQKNGYPDMFRVLCANCNQAYGKFGRCPHKLL